MRSLSKRNFVTDTRLWYPGVVRDSISQLVAGASSVGHHRTVPLAHDSPDSSGMAEAFVKTFRRDYVYLARLTDAASALMLLPTWFLDDNESHLHKASKCLHLKDFAAIA